MTFPWHVFFYGLFFDKKRRPLTLQEREQIRARKYCPGGRPHTWQGNSCVRCGYIK